MLTLMVHCLQANAKFMFNNCTVSRTLVCRAMLIFLYISLWVNIILSLCKLQQMTISITYCMIQIIINERILLFHYINKYSLFSEPWYQSDGASDESPKLRIQATAAISATAA